MNRDATTYALILIATWLSFFVSAEARLRAAGARQSITVDLMLGKAEGGGLDIVARAGSSVLVRVGSLKGLRLEQEASRSKASPSSLGIAYQGIFRGQALVLVTTEDSGEIPADTRFQLSWENELGKVADVGSSEVTHGFRKLTENSVGSSLGSVPAVKIPITEFGLYEIPLGSVVNLFPEGQRDLDFDGLALFYDGKPVPLERLHSETGEGSEVDRLFFHGEGTFNDYTKTNVFWLTDSLSGPLIIEQEEAVPDSSLETPRHFTTTLHAEEDLHIWQTMSRGEGQDHWFWGDKLTAPGSRDYEIAVPFPAASERSTSIRVMYHGLTFSSFHRPDHHVQLSLNQQALGDHFWDDRNISLQASMVPHGLLRGGSNTVTISMPGLPGVAVDQVFINWIEIDYDRLFVADDNRLLFHGVEPKRQTFEVSGLSDPNVDVLEISDLHHPVRLGGFEHRIDNGEGALRFSASPNERSEFLVQGQSERREIPPSTFNKPSFWKDPANGADYIVITHEDFTVSAERLAEYREAQGLRSVVVQIQDIYDEFAFGAFGPQAIRDFLAYAYHHWEAPRPQYVVMFGDAYLDYHDNLETGSINYIPSQQISTELIGLTVSDNWFAQVDGDDEIPDLYIGRIPVRLPVEADRVVDRIIQYETNPAPGDWNSRVALIADDDSAEFSELSNQLATYLPSRVDASRWYADEVADPTSDSVVSLFESGYSMINYAGHGTITSWGLSGNGSILMTSAIAQAIDTSRRWPIVTVANCLNGFFAARHTNSCLAESFLTSPNGGAIAVWAPTSLGFPEGHRILMNEFYKQVFEEKQTTLGAATTSAQIATFVHDPVWLELIETYVLFGDPALRINLRLPAQGPELSLVTGMGGALELRYETSLEFDYTIFASETLGADAVWEPLPGAPHNTGSQVIDPSDADGPLFFRVESTRKRLSPPLSSRSEAL